MGMSEMQHLDAGGWHQGEKRFVDSIELKDLKALSDCFRGREAVLESIVTADRFDEIRCEQLFWYGVV